MYNEETYRNDIMSIDINGLLKCADYDFKIARINFEPLVYDLLGGKIAYKYCDSTLIKKLYEANVIDEYHHSTYFSIKKQLQLIKKKQGYKDEEDLRQKLIAIIGLLYEFCQHLNSKKFNQ